MAPLAAESSSTAIVTTGDTTATEGVVLASSSILGQSESVYFREVARLGAQVADALDYAHKQRVIHRDIKPSNLLLDAQGNVWVTDFGLAKLVEGDDLSHSHDLVGTLRFMAPERFRGVTDARGDVYSLGATLYELLTLKPAFDERDQARLMDRITHEPPSALRQHDRRIPRDLETLVLKALAKDPKDRFATAGELGDELRRYLESRPIRSRPVRASGAALAVVQAQPGAGGGQHRHSGPTGVRDGRAPSCRPGDSIRMACESRMRSAMRATCSTRARTCTTRWSPRRKPGGSAAGSGSASRACTPWNKRSSIARDLKLPPDQFDRLRDEAIACLALPDLKETGQVIHRPPEVVPGRVRHGHDPLCAAVQGWDDPGPPPRR